MKDLFKSFAKAVTKFLTLEVKGFAADSAPVNPTEFSDLEHSQEYDKVGGNNSQNDTDPPKGMILMPFLSNGEGYDPGDTAPSTTVSISITKEGIAETLDFMVINENYNDLYSQSIAESTLVEENEDGEGEFFTIANPDGIGFVSYVSCDSDYECIQVNHGIQDSFNQTGCMLLINKTIGTKELAL